VLAQKGVRPGASDHGITMSGMSRCGQTLSKIISDHQISAERQEFEHLLGNQITDEITVNINMTRVLASDGVF
jgi:hypothetical protein